MCGVEDKDIYTLENHIILCKDLFKNSSNSNHKQKGNHRLNQSSYLLLSIPFQPNLIQGLKSLHIDYLKFLLDTNPK